MRSRVLVLVVSLAMLAVSPSVYADEGYEYPVEPVTSSLDISDLDNVENEPTEWIEIPERMLSSDGADDEAMSRYYDEDNRVRWELVVRDFPSDYNRAAAADSAGFSLGSKAEANAVSVPNVRIEKNPHRCELLKLGTKGYSGAMYMHVRTKSGSAPYGIIGWKPITRCQTAPRSIVHTNTYFRTTTGGLWYPQKVVVGKVFGKTLYEEKDVEYRCGSNKSEDWYGVTSATLLASNGHLYYARQSTNVLWKVSCGI